MHVPGRIYADQTAGITQRESDMQQPAFIGSAQSVKMLFLPAVSFIQQKQERLLEENLLGLCLADIVLIETLAGVYLVPIEAFDCSPIDHMCILSSYTANSAIIDGGDMGMGGMVYSSPMRVRPGSKTRGESSLEFVSKPTS